MYWEALALGSAQAAALVPGVSRSGATLTVAILLGLKRPGAARFVFLMSLPAVLAAAAKETLDVLEVGAVDLPASLFAVGLVVSAIVGYLTIKFFVKYLARHSLTVFAIYRFALAGVAAVWLMS
jgi:undecaprenyl-diphosphatase